MLISFVAGSFTSNDPGTPDVQNTITFPQAIVVGDVLMVIAQTAAVTPGVPPLITSVLDSLGTIYELGGQIQNLPGIVGGGELSAFLYVGVAQSACQANGNTATVSYAASNPDRLVETGAFRGFGGVPILQTTTGTFGNGTAMNAPSLQAYAGNSVIVSYFAVANAVASVGQGSTSPGNDVDGNAYAYQIPTTTGLVSQTATQTAPGGWMSLSTVLTYSNVRSRMNPRGL